MFALHWNEHETQFFWKNKPYHKYQYSKKLCENVINLDINHFKCHTEDAWYKNKYQFQFQMGFKNHSKQIIDYLTFVFLKTLPKQTTEKKNNILTQKPERLNTSQRTINANFIYRKLHKKWTKRLIVVSLTKRTFCVNSY